MTSKNLPLSDDNVPVQPFLLQPVGKSYLWGGTRLNDEFSKGIKTDMLAETWECSTHPDGPSLVASGPFAGKLLTQVLEEHPEFLGTHPASGRQLPIMIKLIDAKQNLSVQVHPDDDYANRNENGQRGKTEVWYVLDATKDAHLIYGLRHSMTKQEIRSVIENGKLEKYLQYVPVHKNDLFFIDAGTIHAIGAGTLVAEIQQSSNLTYRLYDYDRTDREGQKRELHIEKALDVANLHASTEPGQPPRIRRYQQGCATEQLCRCQYFEVHRMLLNTERCRRMVPFRADSSSFRALLCVDGCGCVYLDNGEVLPFFKGDCIFVPAEAAEMRLHGMAQLLDVRG